MGVMTELLKQLEGLHMQSLSRMNRVGGLEVADLIGLISNPIDHTVLGQEPVTPEIHVSSITPECNEGGMQSLLNGETACCFVVSDENLDSEEILKRIESSNLCHATIKWVMVPPHRFDEMKDMKDLKVFRGFECFRLLPDNTVYFQDGTPVYHSCGSGDVFPALLESGLLSTFNAESGKNIVFVDLTKDFVDHEMKVLGHHIVTNRPVTYCVRSSPTSSEGILCSHGGFNKIVEKFRLHYGVPSEDVYSCAANFVAVKSDLLIPSIKLPWHRIKRILGGGVYVQHERFISDMTSLFQTQYVDVTRISSE